jgi:O-antigen ligase
VLALILLVLLGEAKKFGKLLILLPAALAAILLVTSVGGLKITGRIGEINLDFFEEHVRSMSDAQGTPGSSVEGRFRMFDEALQHFRAHPLLGEGFGLPLTSWMDTNNEEGNNAITRTPHNSTVSYLARLGLIGIALWIAFHLSIITRLIYGLRQRAHWDPRLSAFVLWFFLFYVLFMMGSNVEGSFEFPSLAIPFFFFTGFALGLLRWHAPRQNNGERRLAALTSRPTNA